MGTGQAGHERRGPAKSAHRTKLMTSSRTLLLAAGAAVGVALHAVVAKRRAKTRKPARATVT